MIRFALAALCAVALSASPASAGCHDCQAQQLVQPLYAQQLVQPLFVQPQLTYLPLQQQQALVDAYTLPFLQQQLDYYVAPQQLRVRQRQVDNYAAPADRIVERRVEKQRVQKQRARRDRQRSVQKSKSIQRQRAGY